MRIRSAFISAFRPTLPIVVVIISLSMSGCIRNAKLQPYTGQWVLKGEDGNSERIMLHTRLHRGRIVGTITEPQHFTEGPDGKLHSTSSRMKTNPISKGHLKGDSLVMLQGRKPDRDPISMKLIDKDHAQVNLFRGYVPVLPFEKIGSSASTRKH